MSTFGIARCNEPFEDIVAGASEPNASGGFATQTGEREGTVTYITQVTGGQHPAVSVAFTVSLGGSRERND
jgi:hypothetical protein